MRGMLNRIRWRAKRLLARYHSQGAEEAIILSVLGGQRSGFYIDVGAHHPIDYSNTYRLYQRGWHGLCLEPNPALLPKFKAVRPRDVVVAAAAAHYDGTASFHLGHHSVHSSLTHSAARHTGTLEVAVRRLAGLLEELGLHEPIDLISIDTEGTELEVLEGLDLTRHRPRLIVLEYNTAATINLAAQPYLLEHGYQILAVTCWNIIATDRLEQDYASLCPQRRR